MIRFTFIFLFLFIFIAFVYPQSIDTLPKPPRISHRADTVLVNPKDSLWNEALKDSAWKFAADQFPGGNFIKQAYEKNSFFSFRASPVFVRSDKKEFEGKELLFYSLIALMLFFAFIKLAFPKYLADLFRVAFRTTLKQRQIGEQLIQTPLPSLLLNIFFLLTGGLYIDFLLQHYHLIPEHEFWLFFFYSFIFLAVIYLIKFLSLKLSGVIFNISDTTNAYIFIVFMINKIIGICLLPCLVLLAFSDRNIYLISFTLAYTAIFALMAYRFFLSYGLVRNQIRLNPFHFFLYLCAFEIVPLLLIYKLLLLWL